MIEQLTIYFLRKLESKFSGIVLVKGRNPSSARISDFLNKNTVMHLSGTNLTQLDSVFFSNTMGKARRCLISSHNRSDNEVVVQVPNPVALNPNADKTKGFCVTLHFYSSAGVSVSPNSRHFIYLGYGEHEAHHKPKENNYSLYYDEGDATLEGKFFFSLFSRRSVKGEITSFN